MTHVAANGVQKERMDLWDSFDKRRPGSDYKKAARK
jgi:hypothetical protein